MRYTEYNNKTKIYFENNVALQFNDRVTYTLTSFELNIYVNIKLK